MILLALVFAAQSGASEIWEQPTFGPGPHTLVVIEGGAGGIHDVVLVL